MMKKTVKNIIFFSDQINIRAGGPAVYIANLKSAIDDSGRANDNIIFITATPLSKKLDRMRAIGRGLCFWIPRKKFRHSVREKIVNFMHRKLFLHTLDKYAPQTITVHSIRDALLIREYIKSRKINTKLLQMSHSPQPPSQEMYERECAAGNPDAESKYITEKELERNAFESADMYIFPSDESIDCYRGAYAWLDKLLLARPIKYVRTGCRALTTDKTRDEMRKQYNIQTPFVITYIGRHNKIKGYDLLQDIATKVLKQRDDVTFLIGGRPGEIKPLQHPRWIELGQINPAEVLAATDLFILPNRQTYFDLIMLEVLSSGTPIIASDTGGNKTVYKDTGIVTLYKDAADCVRKIETLLGHAPSGSDIKRAWSENYSPVCFAQNYINMIDEVCNEK